MTLKPVVVVLSAFIGLTQFASSQNETSASTTAEKDKDDLIREIRFGNRELNLPSRLQNDELRLKTHGLENDIARLKGENRASTQIQIDNFLIDQDKAAITLANWFAQVWSKGGDPEVQSKLSDAERQCDEADTTCHPHDEAHTLVESKANCASLHEIYTTVSRYQIKLSIPPPSVFGYSDTINSSGAKLLRAYELQLKQDTAAQLPPQIKQTLIEGTQRLMHIDKLLWLQEIFHAETIKYNDIAP